MYFFNFLAFSYFARSPRPLKLEDAASQTYLVPFITFSFHVASHVTSFFSTSVPQAWPGTWHLGTISVSPMFKATCSGCTRVFNVPVLGCAPRPRKGQEAQWCSYQAFQYDHRQLHTHTLKLILVFLLFNVLLFFTSRFARCTALRDQLSG